MKKTVIIAFLAAFTSLMAFGSTYAWTVPVTNIAAEQEIALSSLDSLSSAVIVIQAPYTCNVATVTKTFAATCGSVGTNEITRFVTMEAPGPDGSSKTNTVYFPAKSKSIYVKVAANSVAASVKSFAISAVEGPASTSIKSYQWNIPVSPNLEEQIIKLDSINPLTRAVITLPADFTGQVYTVKRANQAITERARTNDLNLVTYFTNTASRTITNYFPAGSKNIYIKTTGNSLTRLTPLSVGVVATEGAPAGQTYAWSVPLILKGSTFQAITFDVGDALTGLVVEVSGIVTCSYATTLATYPANIGSIFTNNLAPLTVASVSTNAAGGSQTVTNSVVVPDLVKTKTLYIGASGPTASNVETEVTVNIKGKSKVIEKSRFIPF